jgi:dolichyl-phosphate beta-glucosyltransferase
MAAEPTTPKTPARSRPGRPAEAPTAAAPPGPGGLVRVSLVIPAFNSAAYLDANVGAALAFFEAHGFDGEVIVADDGSIDGTADSVRASSAVRVLRLPHRGKGAALRAGMLAATGNIRAFTDADLPYGLEPLPLAISYIRDRRFHAVVGDRTLPGSRYQNPGPLRRVISEVASFAFRTLVTGGIYDTQCGFKVFRGDVASEIFRLARIDGFAIDVELIYLVLKHRLDMKRIPVQLLRNAPSSVRVIRDSLRAVRDIASIRFNLANGRYRSPYLARLLEVELQADVDGARPALPVSSRSST